jgi:hypothetical protein
MDDNSNSLVFESELELGGELILEASSLLALEDEEDEELLLDQNRCIGPFLELFLSLFLILELQLADMESSLMLSALDCEEDEALVEDKD